MAGLAFVGLCLYHRKRLSHALIGSLVYTFSGFVILSAVRHPFFINPMIQLPLLLIGIDCVIKKRQSMIFAFAVFYSALCGFYFFVYDDDSDWNLCVSKIFRLLRCS